MFKWVLEILFHALKLKVTNLANAPAIIRFFAGGPPGLSAGMIPRLKQQVDNIY